MRKAAKDEHRHTQHHRQHLTLTGELDSRRHDETAADSQKETSPGAFRQTTCKDLGGRFHTIGLGIGNEPSREQTTYDIAEKYGKQHRPVALTTNKTSRSRIELQTIIDHCGESESEEDGTSHTSHTEINHTSNGDTDTSKNCGCKSFLKHRLSKYFIHPVRRGDLQASPSQVSSRLP